MIRAVLAVLLTVALLSAATPVIEEGRQARTATHLDGVVDRIDGAVQSLRSHEDPTRPELIGPRRIVRFRIPAPSWTAAGATLRVDGDAVVYRLDGRRPVRTTFRGVDLRTPTGPVVYGPGRHRLVVSLVRDDGIGVVVRRAATGGRG